ncbi:MAG TPA: DUF2306 domain-containing protein [Saprospiraceae bacterium]|nr:DUF2306 domain-containing protein [Saprospiraceae bacterium]
MADGRERGQALSLSLTSATMQMMFRLLAGLCAAAVLAFTGVMAGEVLPYFRFEHAAHFLGTKTDAVLARADFQWAFYVHISSSWIVIMAGLWQFFPALLRRWPHLHRALGKIYVGGILLLAAPSGAVLGLYANGGLSAKVAFALQSLLWWMLTALAWREVLRRRFSAHRDMMIRSYALTLAAMSLRTESWAMHYFWHTKPLETYLTVVWLSWVGNLLLAELLISLISRSGTPARMPPP